MEREHENVQSLLQRGESFLVERGVPNARRNVEWMLSHVMGCRNTDLYIDSDRIPDDGQTAAYRELVNRRGQREPLQYILGSTEFMALPFRMSRGVFIPRPDTELLVETVESWLMDRREDSRVLDLCCGSGIIAVSLAARLPGINLVAVDVDDKAIELATSNAVLNGVSDRVRLVRQDANEFLAGTELRFDVIVSNPPYVPSRDLQKLPPEIRSFEPTISLDGGTDGLDFYREFAPRLGRCLTTRGMVAFEIGDAQADDVGMILGTSGFDTPLVRKDYTGLDRVIVAHCPNANGEQANG